MNLIKACCIDWNEFAPELRDRLVQEIDKIVEDKGIPKSIFATRLNTLRNLHSFCPVCGEGLVEETRRIEPPRETQKPSVPPSSQTPVEKKAYPDITCPICKGEGDRGRDERGIPMKCGKCSGKGFFPGTTWEVKEQMHNGKLIKVIAPRQISDEKKREIEMRHRQIMKEQREKQTLDEKKVSGEDLS